MTVAETTAFLPPHPFVSHVITPSFMLFGPLHLLNAGFRWALAPRPPLPYLLLHIGPYLGHGRSAPGILTIVTQQLFVPPSDFSVLFVLLALLLTPLYPSPPSPDNIPELPTPLPPAAEGGLR